MHRVDEDAKSDEVQWTRRRTGLGLMSTQRRVSRTNPAIAADRGEIRRRWFPGCMGRTESRTGGALASGMPTGRQGIVALGSGITAPLMSIFWLAWAWFSTPVTKSRLGPWLRTCGENSRATATKLRPSDKLGIASWEATNSLPSDCHNESLAWLDSRSGSPPFGAAPTTKTCRRGPRCRAGVRGPSAQRVTRRSSFRHIAPLPVRTRLHSTLPHAPAGQVRWAERHDGKRDLYFQHAA